MIKPLTQTQNLEAQHILDTYEVYSKLKGVNHAASVLQNEAHRLCAELDKSLMACENAFFAQAALQSLSDDSEKNNDALNEYMRKAGIE